MICEPVRLPSGRDLVTDELDAGPTYGLFLECQPTTYRHDLIEAGLIERARRRFFRARPLPVLVAPIHRALAGRDPITGVHIERQLPAVRVMLSCRSAPLDANREGSHAVVVFLAPSLDLARLASLIDEQNWVSTAEDYDS